MLSFRGNRSIDCPAQGNPYNTLPPSEWRNLWDRGQGVGGRGRRRLGWQGNQLHLAFFDLTDEGFMLGSRSVEFAHCKFAGGVGSVEGGRRSHVCPMAPSVVASSDVVKSCLVVRTLELSKGGCKVVRRVVLVRVRGTGSNAQRITRHGSRGVRSCCRRVKGCLRNPYNTALVDLPSPCVRQLRAICIGRCSRLHAEWTTQRTK